MTTKVKPYYIAFDNLDEIESGDAEFSYRKPTGFKYIIIINSKVFNQTKPIKTFTINLD